MTESQAAESDYFGIWSNLKLWNQNKCTPSKPVKGENRSPEEISLARVQYIRSAFTTAGDILWSQAWPPFSATALAIPHAFDPFEEACQEG